MMNQSNMLDVFAVTLALLPNHSCRHTPRVHEDDKYAKIVITSHCPMQHRLVLMTLNIADGKQSHCCHHLQLSQYTILVVLQGVLLSCSVGTTPLMLGLFCLQ